VSQATDLEAQHLFDYGQAFVSDTHKRWFFSGLVPLLMLLVVAGGLLAWRVDINVFSMHNF
jgi:hypothetical protein